MCETCIRVKQSRCSFPTSYNKSVALFELVHYNLWGPYRTTDHCDARYFITLVDDFSRSVWLFLLPTKQDVSRTLSDFIALVEHQFTVHVKVIRSDNDT